MNLAGSKERLEAHPTSAETGRIAKVGWIQKIFMRYINILNIYDIYIYIYIYGYRVDHEPGPNAGFVQVAGKPLAKIISFNSLTHVFMSQQVLK